ncbi:hypothetical protein ACFPM7_06185 [Actinokineospora guangxiensis]|uniref:Lanthionine synthetase-like protein n=1 Tax=Actinokineospora guangxiensis TaxID=1490288 RepID=A0ABW0EJZ4_9PSEU
MTRGTSDRGAITRTADQSTPTTSPPDGILDHGVLAAALTRWLATDGPRSRAGAYCGWLDLASGTPSDPYPEITGYALTFLSHDPAFARCSSARAAGRWLTERVERGDLSARPRLTGDAAFSFDIGMVAHGLIRHGRAAGDHRALAAGVRAAEVLITHRAGGPLPTVLPGTAATPLPIRWSTVGRPHLVKVVQSLIAAADLGVPDAEAAAYDLVRERVRETSSPPPTARTSDAVWLHPLAYAAEGLWMWSTRHDDSAASRRSRELTEWLWRQRLADGGFARYAERSGRPGGHPGTLDVLAQAIRLAMLHDIHTEAALREAERLAALCHREADRTAVPYRVGTADLHLNSWCSMFAAQALWLCASPGRSLGWGELV